MYRMSIWTLGYPRAPQRSSSLCSDWAQRPCSCRERCSWCSHVRWWRCGVTLRGPEVCYSSGRSRGLVCPWALECLTQLDRSAPSQFSFSLSSELCAQPAVEFLVFLWQRRRRYSKWKHSVESYCFFLLFFLEQCTERDAGLCSIKSSEIGIASSVSVQ